MTDRCVVFDLDGVLVMSEHLWEQGWESVSAEHGYAWLPEDTRTCQGKSVPEWARYVSERTGMDEQAAADDVIAVVAAAYDRNEVPLIDGALELVQAAAMRVPVALASSAPRAIIDRVMATTPVGEYFAATVSSAEVAAGKPAPTSTRRPSPGWVHAARAALRSRTRATASGPPQPRAHGSWAWNTRCIRWIATLQPVPPASITASKTSPPCW